MTMRFKGLGVSPGVGVGTAVVLRGTQRDFGFSIPAGRIPREVERLQTAREAAREQIRQIKARVAARAGVEHAYIFDAQLLMLDDRMLIDRAIEIITGSRVNAEAALQRTFEEISALFASGDDPYLRERRGDVSDVVNRLRGNLRSGGDPLDSFRQTEGPIVLVADELTPSVVAQLDSHRLAGLVSDEGSWTYHTAILARSIRLPAIAGLRNASARIAPGSTVALDGTTGDLLVDPDADELSHIRARGQQRAAFEQSLEEYRRLPAVTADGVEIRLEANIETPDDAERARERGADGIGLFRSEFLLAGGGSPALTEETQYQAYRKLLTAAAPATVTVRTFDLSEMQLPGGRDPAADSTRAPLGLRGIRLSLAMDDLFQAQLRALLRAAQHGSLRIMFPFVSGVDELRAAREAMARAADTLRARGISVPGVPTGVMIEVPSAALTADLLAAEADFFSIGTNDLIQYCLAVDRTDEQVSRLYEPLHPAILRMLRHVARAGKRRGIRVAVCGEMAADPVLLTLLVGLGLTEFSMAPTALPLAKQVLRDLRVCDATRVGAIALRAATAADVERALIDFMAPETNPELRTSKAE
jgi:phosphotransferase system enzyme I (PtsI)